MELVAIFRGLFLSIEAEDMAAPLYPIAFCASPASLLRASLPIAEKARHVFMPSPFNSRPFAA